MEPEIKKLACDLIVKAYEHHKMHARHEEAQRAWMVAAYFTFTGFLYGGVVFADGSQTGEGYGGAMSELALTGLLAHLVMGVFVMKSVAKVSGEFTRHFSCAEKILGDVDALCASDPDLKKAFKHVALETAGHEPPESLKARLIRLLSNAAMHNYMFAFLTAVDIYLLSGCVMAAGIWFAVVSFLLFCYVGFIVRRLQATA